MARSDILARGSKPVRIASDKEGQRYPLGTVQTSYQQNTAV